MRGEKERDAAGEPAASTSSRTIQKTILVVEDDNTHRTFMEQILKDAGYATVPAENGLVALSRLDKGPRFDLVIMDWDMPALNGLEAVKAIRARQVNEGAPHIPVIAFTGKKQRGDREKCLAAGMDAYLPKDVWMPQWRKTLLQRLDELMEDGADASGLGEIAAGIPQDEIRSDFDLDAFSPETLDEVKSLLRGTFSEMIEEYLEDAAAYIRDIREGLKNGDRKKVERGSHPLKSNSKGLGLTAVSAIAESINVGARQALAENTSLESVEPLLPQLEEAFRRAETRLRAFLRNGH